MKGLLRVTQQLGRSQKQDFLRPKHTFSQLSYLPLACRAERLHHSDGISQGETASFSMIINRGLE